MRTDVEEKQARAMPYDTKVAPLRIYVPRWRYTRNENKCTRCGRNRKTPSVHYLQTNQCHVKQRGAEQHGAEDLSSHTPSFVMGRFT